MYRDDQRCPCGSGLSYGPCCARHHRGESTAPTAQQLMRSRFSAFAVGDREYLLRSWHRSTRPRELDLDETIRWVRLEVHSSEGGGLFDNEGTVEFTAHYRHDGERARLHEVSRFRRDDGAWFYLDALT